MAAPTLILWDCVDDVPVGAGVVYRWNGHADSEGAFSLLRYVETHAVRLRSRYLAWVHDLGETAIAGQRLIDRFAIDRDFSYWWMTLVAESSPYKSPIGAAIRLLAFEEIVRASQPRALRLVSGDRVLHETIAALCRRLGIDYTWERRASGPPLRPWTARTVYGRLPHVLRGLATLVWHVLRRRVFRSGESAPWFSGERTVFFCSYFGVDAAAAAAGRFQPRHWNGVPAQARRSGLTTNWLHHYYPHDAVPSPAAAVEQAARINAKRSDEGCHAFLDANLSAAVVCRVLRGWLSLVVLSYRLRGVAPGFRPHDSALTLWPLLQDDWYASLRGASAVQNLLYLELFDAALRRMPHQRIGLYLCENQPWERALLRAWRKYGHGRIIGTAAHVFVRFWDLRYFPDPRTVNSSGERRMPRPDLLALNGKAAIAAYGGDTEPQAPIVECEATHSTPPQASRVRSPRQPGTPLRVLVLGDYIPASSARMMRLLEAAYVRLSGGLTCTVKSHPDAPLRAADYPLMPLTMADGSLPMLLEACDVVYSSNMTSAVMPGYFAGVPVVVALDDNELNMSPLRGLPAARFVSTANELAAVLRQPLPSPAAAPNYHEFFFADAELPRWRRLLSAHAAS